jgi:hypothetical protein
MANFGKLEGMATVARLEISRPVIMPQQGGEIDVTACV